MLVIVSSKPYVYSWLTSIQFRIIDSSSNLFEIIRPVTNSSTTLNQSIHVVYIVARTRSVSTSSSKIRPQGCDTETSI